MSAVFEYRRSLTQIAPIRSALLFYIVIKSIVISDSSSQTRHEVNNCYLYIYRHPMIFVGCDFGDERTRFDEIRRKDREREVLLTESGVRRVRKTASQAAGSKRTTRGHKIRHSTAAYCGLSERASCKARRSAVSVDATRQKVPRSRQHRIYVMHMYR